MNYQKGQSLVEVVIALGIAVVIIIAFTNATTGAVRASQFAKNQNQATKIAQQTIEIVRAIRDQDNNVNTNATWSSLWNETLGTINAGDSYKGRCYSLNESAFTLSPTSSVPGNTCTAANDTLVTSFANSIYKRKINITDDGTVISRKTVTVKVYWEDSKGTHTAEASTILSNWN